MLRKHTNVQLQSFLSGASVPFNRVLITTFACQFAFNWVANLHEPIHVTATILLQSTQPCPHLISLIFLFNPKEFQTNFNATPPAEKRRSTTDFCTQNIFFTAWFSWCCINFLFIFPQKSHCITYQSVFCQGSVPKDSLPLRMMDKTVIFILPIWCACPASKVPGQLYRCKV